MNEGLVIGLVTIGLIMCAMVVWEKLRIDRAWAELIAEAEQFDERVKRTESQLNARSLALHRMEAK